MIVIGLVVIFFIKSTVSDQTAGLFQEIVGDPDLVLPESVSDKSKTLNESSSNKPEKPMLKSRNPAIGGHAMPLEAAPGIGGE